MQARDAAGRQISLLNEEPAGSYGPVPQRLSYHAASQILSQPFHPASTRTNSSASIPPTPELLRSDSYDSNISTGPKSPLTPTTFDYARGHSMVPLAGQSDDFNLSSKKPSGVSASRPNSYDEPSPATTSVPDGRAGKRYPCRYRESHGCEKTFTTSGHASRHSKIHTAEKAVQCTFPGCQKKFTRADNMKQHLETHYKDKSRSMGSVKSSSRNSVSASSRRSSSTSSSSSARTSTRPRTIPDRIPWDMEPYSFAPSGSTSVASAGPWDLRALNAPLMSRPNAARTPSSGLDALAMAVACQEGA